MNKGMFPLEQMLWIVRIAFMIFLVVSTIGLVRYYANARTETTVLEMSMLARRIASVPGFATTDERTGRVYPAVITQETIKQDNTLHSKIYYPENQAAARIDIQDRRGNTIGTGYYHKSDFEKWVVQAGAGWTGIEKETYHMPQDIGQTVITVVKS